MFIHDFGLILCCIGFVFASNKKVQIKISLCPIFSPYIFSLSSNPSSSSRKCHVFAKWLFGFHNPENGPEGPLTSKRPVDPLLLEASQIQKASILGAFIASRIWEAPQNRRNDEEVFWNFFLMDWNHIKNRFHIEIYAKIRKIQKLRKL